MREDLSKFQASHEFDDLVNYYTTCWAISYRGEEAQGIKGSERFMEAAAELTIEIRQTLIEKRGMTFEQVVDHVTMQSAKKSAEILEHGIKLTPKKNGKPYDGSDCFHLGCLEDLSSWYEGFEKALQYCIASLR